MIVTTSYNLGGKLIVAFAQASDLHQTISDVSRKRLSLAQTSREHVTFDVFAEKVFAAHRLGINHPHPHTLSFILAIRASRTSLNIELEQPLPIIGYFESFSRIAMVR